jgi:hypothetical protein
MTIWMFLLKICWWEKQKVDNNLMFTSYEGNNCFIIPQLLKDVKILTVLICSRQQNNFRYIENTITQPHWEKHGFSRHLSACQEL